MSTVNVLTNNAPTHAIATIIDSLVADASQTKGPALPGSIGEQNNDIQKQLAQAGVSTYVNASA